MTSTDLRPVTVLGLGSMGRAVASAFIAAGYPTTVWNRTADRVPPLVAQGAMGSHTVADAVAASPLVITCLAGFDETRTVLATAAAQMYGRTLVTLCSGSPAAARAMSAWAADHGTGFLGGAVKNVPSAVGGPNTLVYYGGDRSVFDAYRSTLAVLGGTTVHLGDEPDLAAFYEMAVGATLLPALVGFFQGAAALQGRGLDVASMVPYSVSWLEMIASLLPALAREIDLADYADPQASVDLFVSGIGWDEEFAREAGVDATWAAPLHDLLRRAVTAGHGPDSISALVEFLRVPGAASVRTSPSRTAT